MVDYLDLILNRLHNTSKSITAQKVLLLSWIVSLKLQKPDGEDLIGYLKIYKESIDPDILLHLFLSHDREKEAIWIANQTKQHKPLIIYYIVHERVKSALEYMCNIESKESKSEMMLKYLSVFLKHEPIGTIGALRDEFKNLPLENLLPALTGVKYSYEHKQMVVNYLKDFIESYDTEIALVHNLYVYLLATESNLVFDDMLLQYLDSQEARYRRRMPVYLYRTLALYECQRFNKKQALIRIYSMLDYNEKSVMLALELDDLKRAKEYANYAAAIENDREIGKSLWMSILKAQSSKKETKIEDLLDILNASKGYLTINDVLQFSSSHIKLEKFESSLSAQFTKLNEEIKSAKEEIGRLVDYTEERRKKVVNLRKTVLFIDGSAICELCKERLVELSRLVVFPCKHSFHRDCIFEWLLINSACHSSTGRMTEKEKAYVESFLKSLCAGKIAVSYTHLRAHETSLHLVCRLLLEKKKKKKK
eukprot:TRINITY_DN13467_c0_g2_i1.p1 TRINITY_DN13467_c0_g2~~TRINITY_DN13467_c0_g2_i1.p1  ORF type:complete len:492 (+),score=163.13 TRINITY_DN13467_c0_g2_i1:41-1477(+)